MACGCSIQSTSVYANVNRSPVFWIFGSNNFRFWLISVVERSIPGSSASSAGIDQKSTGTIPVGSDLLISIVVYLLSARDLSLKLVTINPDLNLLRPVASVTSRVCALSSSILKLVTSSRFSILCSSFAISRIVNLLLSLNKIFGSFWGLNRYAG